MLRAALVTVLVILTAGTAILEAPKLVPPRLVPITKPSTRRYFMGPNDWR